MSPLHCGQVVLRSMMKRSFQSSPRHLEVPGRHGSPGFGGEHAHLPTKAVADHTVVNKPLHSLPALPRLSQILGRFDDMNFSLPDEAIL
jgi:hypothetical protein